MDINLNQSEVNRKYNMLASGMLSLQNQLEELRKEIASGGGGGTELPIMVEREQEVLKLENTPLISVDGAGDLRLNNTTIDGFTTTIRSTESIDINSRKYVTIQGDVTSVYGSDNIDIGSAGSDKGIVNITGTGDVKVVGHGPNGIILDGGSIQLTNTDSTNRTRVSIGNNRTRLLVDTAGESGSASMYTGNMGINIYDNQINIGKSDTGNLITFVGDRIDVGNSIVNNTYINGLRFHVGIEGGSDPKILTVYDTDGNPIGKLTLTAP